MNKIFSYALYLTWCAERDITDGLTVKEIVNPNIWTVDVVEGDAS